MPGIPVLCYHKVGPISESGRFLNIEPSRFKQQIEFFQRRDTRFVLAKDLADIRLEGNVVCLTFDDSYTSALTYGREVMLSKNVRGTFYAVAERIGRTSDWDEERAQPLAPLELLLEAQDQGFEIGNHTKSHPKLNELDPKSQAEEIIHAATTLKGYGLTIESFAYPYGLSDASARNLVATSHRIGLALGKRLANSQDPRDSIPRFVVSYSDSIPKLIYKIWLRNRFRQPR